MQFMSFLLNNCHFSRDELKPNYFYLYPDFSNISILTFLHSLFCNRNDEYKTLLRFIDQIQNTKNDASDLARFDNHIHFYNSFLVTNALLLCNPVCFYAIQCDIIFVNMLMKKNRLFLYCIIRFRVFYMDNLICFIFTL